jgi:hopanoid biosynthesis associated radical SAM protein HpnH
MRFPVHITTDMIRHQVANALRGRRRYPFVMMLEPLYTCNLACLGCSVERHTGKLADRLPVETCLEALDDCGAPAVSICGGEPTVYPELPELVAGIIARRKHIYLCTNALLLDRKVFGVIPPHRRLTVNVHLDGMRHTHDMVCDRAGVFDKAIEMIRQAKRLGYHVITNTTVFKETDIDEVRELCALLAEIGVDGMLISPGYHYEGGRRAHSWDGIRQRFDQPRERRRISDAAERQAGAGAIPGHGGAHLLIKPAIGEMALVFMKKKVAFDAVRGAREQQPAGGKSQQDHAHQQKLRLVTLDEFDSHARMVSERIGGFESEIGDGA